MLSKDERNEIKRIKRLMELEKCNQYDVVTTFYPAQQLTLTLTEEDVVDIMNCAHSEAKTHLNNVRKNLGKDENWEVRSFDFCDYLDIDEMFIQLFLASLKIHGPLPPVKNNGEEAFTTVEIYEGPPRKLNEVKESLQQGIMESFEIVENRLRVWHLQNPLGEPMCSPAFKNWRIVIRPFEVAQILHIHIDTARQMFKEAREDNDLPKQRFMSIRLFCKAHELDEEDTRKALAHMYDETTDEPRF